MRAKSLTRTACRCPAGICSVCRTPAWLFARGKKKRYIFLILLTRKCLFIYFNRSLEGKTVRASKACLRGSVMPEHLPLTCDLRSTRDVFPGRSSVRWPSKLLSALNPAVCLFCCLSRARAERGQSRRPHVLQGVAKETNKKKMQPTRSLRTKIAGKFICPFQQR